MGINTQIIKLHRDLCDTINASELPISIVKLVLEKINTEVSILEGQALMAEANEDSNNEDPLSHDIEESVEIQSC